MKTKFLNINVQGLATKGHFERFVRKCKNDDRDISVFMLQEHNISPEGIPNPRGAKQSHTTVEELKRYAEYNGFDMAIAHADRGLNGTHWGGKMTLSGEHALAYGQQR